MRPTPIDMGSPYVVQPLRHVGIHQLLALLHIVSSIFPSRECTSTVIYPSNTDHPIRLETSSGVPQRSTTGPIIDVTRIVFTQYTSPTTKDWDPGPLAQVLEEMPNSDSKERTNSAVGRSQRRLLFPEMELTYPTI